MLNLGLVWDSER